MAAEHDRMLTKRIARHFPEAQISEVGIALGFGGINMACRVESCESCTSLVARLGMSDEVFKAGTRL